MHPITLDVTSNLERASHATHFGPSTWKPVQLSATSRAEIGYTSVNEGSR